MNALEFPLQTFELQIDGQSLFNRWEWVGAGERDAARPGTREAVIELQHQVRPVRVKVVTRLDGTPFLVRYLEITNTGSAPAALAGVSPCSGLLWSSRENTGLLSRGYRQCVYAGLPGQLSLGGGRQFHLGAAAARHAPYQQPDWAQRVWRAVFHARNEVTGEYALGRWHGRVTGSWSSGRTRCATWKMGCERGCNLAFRMGPQAPRRCGLAPGETVTSPEMHLALLHAGLDDCVDALAPSTLLTSVLPPRPPGKAFTPSPGAWWKNPASGSSRKSTSPRRWACRRSWSMPAGMAMSSSGWWERRGDWWEGSWMPGGLAACRERAHRHGMAVRPVDGTGSDWPAKPPAAGTSGVGAAHR